MLLGSVGYAADVEVANNSDSGSGSLRQAIVDVGSGDTITFNSSLDGGIITLTSTELNISTSLIIDASALSSSITINGGGNRIFYISNANSGDVEIRGITITDGSHNNKGGGISNEGTGTLKIYDSVVTSNNVTGGSGGGIYNEGTLTINNSIVSDNTSSNGGGIYNASAGTLTLENSTIIGDDSTNNSADNGGGIYNLGTLTLNDSTVKNNEATSGNGGGIYNNGKLTINNTTIDDNTASSGGGIQIGPDSGDVTLTNCTISNNTAKHANGGGAIRTASSATTTITNCTISNNHATKNNSNGGGIISKNGTLNLNNSTVYGNDIGTGTGTGGGIYRYTGTVSIKNTIIAGNIKGTSTPDDCGGTITSNGYNLFGYNSTVGDTGCPTDNTTNNISTVLNTTLDTEDGTHHLKPHDLSTSFINPAIDTGDNASLPNDIDDWDEDGSTTEEIPFDQRGASYPRTYDGDTDGISTVDIGAYEYNPPTITTNPGLTVERNNTVTITSSELEASDVQDTDTNSLIFTITDLSTENELKNDGSTLAVNDTFTQQDINDNKLSYFNNDGTGSYAFKFTVHDSSDEVTTEQVFNITVEDHPPTVDINTRIAVENGNTIIISNSELAASDVQDDNNLLTFTIISEPTNGILKNNTTPLVDNNTFTQQTITNNELNYTHNDSLTTSDSFTFTVHDSINPPIATQIFNITIGDKPNYILTVNPTGSGTVTGSGNYPEGTSVSITATPDSGYEFSGWSTGCSNSFTITSDITCTATFTKIYIPPVDTGPPPPPPLPQTMKLFIEMDGGGTGIFELSPRYNEKVCSEQDGQCHYVYNTATKVTITAIADKNSNFEYWGGASSCRKGSQTDQGGEVAIYLIKSLTCKLNFKLKPQKLMLNYEGEGNGTVKVSPDRGTVTACEQDKCIIFDGTKDITLTPEPDSYSRFDEWTGHEDCMDDGEIAALAMISNKLCNANFVLLPTYGLTVGKTGSGTGVIVQEPTGKNCVDNVCEYAEGSEVVLTAQADPVSSTFAGWSENCNNGNLTITTDITCTANFMQKPTYQLSLQTNGDGNITANPPPPIDDKYFAGQIVTLVPELGVNIKGVDFIGDCDSDKIVMDKDKSCLVKFTEAETPPIDPEKPYTLHLIIEGANGTVLVNSLAGQTTCNGYCTNNYSVNTLVSMGIQPTANARFTGWSEECISGQIIMVQTKACTATFEPIYTLSVAKKGAGNGTITSDSGINCGEHCQTVQQVGDVVTLIVTPTPESIFESWNSSCFGGQVTINASKICTATFTKKPTYKLTVATEGIGNGKIESNPVGIDCGDICEAQFLKEEIPMVVKLTPYANPGSIFTAWSCEDETIIGVKDIIMDGNQHCTAKFDSYGTLQFAIDSPLEVNEETDTIILAVKRVGGTLGEVATDYKTTDGGANSEDYTAQQGTLTWQDGQNDTQFITIPILADKLAEADETFVVTLLNSTGNAVLGTPHQLEITIKDVPWQSYVQFAMPEYEVNESEKMIRLIATRAGSSRIPIEVAIRTENGTANDDDYQLVQTNLAWDSGDMEPKSVDINISQDELEGIEEYFLVAIDKITEEGLELDPDKIVTVVTIFDTPPTGSVEFDRTSYNIDETDQIVEILVNRVGGSSGEISVEYATLNGTGDDEAIAGQDFNATSGTLRWTDGDTTAKLLTVPIILDNVKETAETFSLNLSNPTGGAALGVQNSTTIEIADMTGGSLSSGDDEVNYPGILKFSQTEYTVLEGVGEAVISVERIGGQFGEVKVKYTTQDDIIATAGIVYEPTSGELIWDAGDAEAKQFAIKLFDNDFIGTDQVLYIKLSESTGGTFIENNEAVINIQDDDKAIFVLSADAYANYEGKDAIVRIFRLGDNYISKVALDYTIEDETAIAGEDYTKVVKTLVWESGDTTVKEVKIPLRFDRLEEDKETFLFTLAKASNSATIGTPDTATITIVETDPADCKPTTNGNSKQQVACYLANKPEVVIENLTVEPYGTIDGGTLKGTIHNSGLIQNVTLTSGTVLEGGIIAGNIVGEAGANECVRPLLKGVEIAAGTTLSNVIIGSDAVFDPINTKLGIGMVFEDNSLIPNDISLELMLGQMPPIFGQPVTILTNDVLCNINHNGILGVINELVDVKTLIGRLKQHAEYGYLYAYFGELRYALLPMQVKHILRTQVIDLIPQGLTITDDNKVTFITHLGREVIAHPVVQAPTAFNEALQALGLEPAIMLNNGNIQVNTSNTYFYQGRASLTAAITNNPIGLHTDSIPVSLVFTDSDRRRQQFIYPAAADTEALYALPATKLTNEGLLTVQINNRSYTGLLDYVVTKENSKELSIQEVGDVNGDNCPDHKLNYPNGNSQIIFCTP